MPFTIDVQEYREEQINRIPSYYNTNRAKLTGFESRQRFIDWYFNELNLHDNRCHYCNTSILDIRRLINAGIINGRAVRNGALRGPNFELDRRDPFGVYNEENCVLCCYYCNNDKSNTFSYEIFLNIIGPAKGIAWGNLLNRL